MDRPLPQVFEGGWGGATLLAVDFKGGSNSSTQYEGIFNLCMLNFTKSI